MHLSRPSARFGVLAAAVALVAMLVAVPSASAASISGGPIKIDIKLKGASATYKGTTTKSSKTFPFAENAGTVTLTKQASGSLNIGKSSDSITIKRGSKTIVLQSFVEKLSAGKGQLTAKIKGKGKAIAFFDQASTNRVNPAADFTTLGMTTAKMTLTKAGAAAINKALGLKAPKRGQKDQRYKAKAAAGSASFTANRSLTVTGGESRTVYDTQFVDTLASCGISLGAVAPATAIPQEASSAPRGGVVLPIDAASGGTLGAATLVGSVNHLGGTVLDRPEPGQPGNPTTKPRYNSPLRDFVFGLQGANNPASLSAFIVNINLATQIGTIPGAVVTPNLTADGGAVALVGDLTLSDAASANLSGSAPPLGADCQIPPGSKIGRATMQANVS